MSFQNKVCHSKSDELTVQFVNCVDRVTNIRTFTTCWVTTSKMMSPHKVQSVRL